MRLLFALAFLVISLPTHAQDIPRTFLCENFTGLRFAAPTWKAEPDALTGQQVLIDFRGTKSTSHIKWYREGKVYYENSGVGVTMTGGFAIISFGDEYIETYAFNSGTSELLMSMTRSGSSILPNSIKSLRGVCKPAGVAVR